MSVIATDSEVTFGGLSLLVASESMYTNKSVLQNLIVQCVSLRLLKRH